MKKWIACLSGIVSLGLSLIACATLLPPATSTPEPTETILPSPTAPPPTPTLEPTEAVIPSPTSPPATLESSDGAVNQVAWSPDGALLAVAGSEGVYVYTVETLEKLSTLKTSAVTLAFSPDGQTLATAQDETLQLWEVSKV